MAAVVGWFVWATCTDSAGSFSAPQSLDVAMYRVQARMGVAADSAETAVQDTNDNMQGVVVGRHRRNNKRIKTSGGDVP